MFANFSLKDFLCVWLIQLSVQQKYTQMQFFERRWHISSIENKNCIVFQIPNFQPNIFRLQIFPPTHFTITPGWVQKVWEKCSSSIFQDVFSSFQKNPICFRSIPCVLSFVDLAAWDGEDHIRVMDRMSNVKLIQAPHLLEKHHW